MFVLYMMFCIRENRWNLLVVRTMKISGRLLEKLDFRHREQYIIGNANDIWDGKKNTGPYTSRMINEILIARTSVKLYVSVVSSQT